MGGRLKDMPSFADEIGEAALAADSDRGGAITRFR